MGSELRCHRGLVRAAPRACSQTTCGECSRGPRCVVCEESAGAWAGEGIVKGAEKKVGGVPLVATHCSDELCESYTQGWHSTEDKCSDKETNAEEEERESEEMQESRESHEAREDMSVHMCRGFYICLHPVLSYRATPCLYVYSHGRYSLERQPRFFFHGSRATPSARQCFIADVLQKSGLKQFCSATCYLQHPSEDFQKGPERSEGLSSVSSHESSRPENSHDIFPCLRV